MRTDRNQRGSLFLVVMCLMFIMTAVVIGWPSGNSPHRIVGGWLAAVITDSKLTHRKINHTAAFYLAEAGVEHAKEYLSAQANLRSAVIRTAGTIPASTVIGASSVPFGAGSYTTSINVALGSWSIPIYTISSVGTADPDGTAGSGDEVGRKIIVKASLGSFARYAYFTDSEPAIWFITTDALLGLVHTNGSFHIAGRPDYWGKTTSVGSQFYFYNNGSSVPSTSDHNGTRDVPLFRDGYELSATSVYYPTDTTDIQTAAAGARGLIINTDTRITLAVGAGNVGKLTYVQMKTDTWSGWNDEHTIYHTSYRKESYPLPGTQMNADVFDSENSPSGKAVVYVNGAAEVSGTLAGQLTILTKGDLVVTGDILYRVDPVDYDGDGLLSDADGDGINDPGFDRNGDGLFTLNGEKPDDTDDNGDGTADTTGYNQPESTDTLGLVAKGDVVVQDTGGTGVNRKISGTVMALGTADRTGTGTGSFRVENYNDGDIQGTLMIVGGLIQKQRGAVGSFSGDITGQPTKTSGYSKNYIYDRRVLYFPPPYFPPTNMFDLIYWQEVAL